MANLKSVEAAPDVARVGIVAQHRIEGRDLLWPQFPQNAPRRLVGDLGGLGVVARSLDVEGAPGRAHVGDRAPDLKPRFVQIDGRLLAARLSP